MATDLVRGSVVAFGGWDAQHVTRDDTWEWGGSSWMRRTPPVSPPQRTFAMSCFIPGRGVFCYGGWASLGGVAALGDAWLYDGTTWTRQVATQSPPTNGFGIDYLAAYDHLRRAIVVQSTVGTADGQGYASQYWEWDGGSWSQPAIGTTPQSRASGGLAWYSGSRVCVLFGGRVPGRLFNDTWEWDGTVWTQRFPANRPSPRSRPLLAEDTARGVLLLCGGAGPSTLADAWEWDGTNWHQVFAPILRSPLAMAFDARRSRMLVYGIGNANTYEAWEHDGQRWNPTFAPCPQGLWYPGMAYDSSRGVTVLHGTRQPGDVLETWEWDGAQWTAGAATGPANGSLHTLVYDAARQRILGLASGSPAGGMVSGTPGHWYYGTAALGPASQETAPGTPLSFGLDLPVEAGAPFVCGLSLGSEVGIPLRTGVAGETLVWPLRNDLLLRLSLQVPGLWGALDGQGRGTASLPVPADPGLVGLLLSASALTFGPGAQVRTITRDVRALIAW